MLCDSLSPDPMEIPGKAMHIYLQPKAIPSQISIAGLIPLAKSSNKSYIGSFAKTSHHKSNKTYPMVYTRVFCS